MKKRLTIVMAVVCCMALMVGTMAFFTDRATADTGATAGNINLVWEDTSVNTYDEDAAAGEIGNNEFCQNDVWDNGALVTGENIINPGDAFNMDYTFTNTGNKSIDVRQRIILVSNKDLTESAPEYKLTITGGNDQQAVTGELQADGKTIIYDLADITINGSKESEDGAVTGAYTVKFDFAKAADNDFMDSTVTINLYAAAKQHRNTVEGDFPGFELMASVMSGDYEDIPDTVAP